jgi:hypothetical protein
MPITTIFIILILALLYYIGHLSSGKANLERLVNKTKKELELENIHKSKLEDELLKCKECLTTKDQLYETLKAEDIHTFTKISSLYSDYLLTQYDISSKYLSIKSHPAHKEAARIKDLKLETKAYIEQYRQMVYKYEYLLQLFPELSEYVDDFATIKQLDNLLDFKSLEDDFDRTQFYLSKQEFNTLSVNQRNQLALDRYIKGQKSRWQIGRDYELFCGLSYEKQGWDVEYSGMEKKLEDLGRDLIAKKKNEHLVIQCKYWSQDKIIHEKHIAQLFGTTIMYGMDVADTIQVRPVFITSTEISPQAKKFAMKLGVELIENHLMEEFPRIKCNVNRDEDGFESRIYHLPFDQQYDRTKINKKNEFYAFTVDEAVNAGFRRAYRYFASN